LDILQDDTEINSNTAGNHGGGIAVVGQAKGNIGSPGVIGVEGQIGVVNHNTATYGGGIATLAGSDENEGPVVKLFAMDGTNPVEINSNSATHTGGGIYLKGYTNAFPLFSNYAYLCAWDFRIEDNIAQEGAAIYGDVDSGVDDVGSFVELGSCYQAGGFPTALGAVACKNSALCNSIDENEATDQSQGSAILIQDQGLFSANRLAMRNNHVAHAIRIVGDSTSTFLSDCLLANNTIADELIYLTGNVTSLAIEGCTFANNTIGATHVIHTESDLSINDSIIAEPGTLALDYSGIPANLSVHYVVSNDVTTLGGVAPGVIQGSPTFVDPAGGDYHLRAGYLGVDLAPVPDGFDRTQGVDLDGNLRTIDLPTVLNAYGPRDIGAYEVQNLFRECGVQSQEEIYCDGFNY
jgi:predicted outer membrane repeat protein